MLEKERCSSEGGRNVAPAYAASPVKVEGTLLQHM